MAQCVRGARVVCFNRMGRLTVDEAAVVATFGVSPTSIPDWFALVGDAADGIPGVPRWGGKSASALLARHQHLEAIPDDETQWHVAVRGAGGLAGSLRQHREEALMYRLKDHLDPVGALAQDYDVHRLAGVGSLAGQPAP